MKGISNTSMNYYNEIKNNLIDNEITKRVKDYSKNKIKLRNQYNYIDLLLYNIEFNCYVAIELKVTKLKIKHVGQIKIYMNYIDTHIKNITKDKTIGIIICKKNNKYIIEYCSDKRIIAKEYKIL